MKPIFKEFDNEFPRPSYFTGDRLEYSFTSTNEAEYMKMTAEEIISERDLPLEVDVETWSRGGVPFKITLVVTELQDNYGDTEKYENLKSQISW